MSVVKLIFDSKLVEKNMYYTYQMSSDSSTIIDRLKMIQGIDNINFVTKSGKYGGQSMECLIWGFKSRL